MLKQLKTTGVEGETINTFGKFFDKVGGGMDAATEVNKFN
jgi:hypothetical protein